MHDEKPTASTRHFVVFGAICLMFAGSLSAEGNSYEIIMHARGLGDDSPMAVYQTLDDLMRDWPIENNSTFIIKPVVTRHAPWPRLYRGDTVVATERGARRLGRRAPEIYSLSA